MSTDTRQWTHVYVIYSADTIAESPSFIESMAPAKRHNAELFADAFTLTEGDDQYDYGYLASEGAGQRYLAYADREADEDPNAGMHRKWVAELSRQQWLAFAEGYCIDLGDDDLPERYEDTLGSITEYGHIPAIAVDNSEGWGCGYYGYDNVIDSQMYLSFGGNE